MRAKEIKFYPENLQETTLLKWFDGYVFTYNLSIEAIIKHGFKSNISDFSLRDDLVKESNIPLERSFLLGVPFNIRGGAVLEACSHQKAEVTKFYKGGYDAVKALELDLYRTKKLKEKAVKDSTKLKHQIKIDEIENKIKNYVFTYAPKMTFRKKRSPRLVMDICKADCRITKDGVISIFVKTLGVLKTKEKLDFCIVKDKITGKLSLQHDIKICFDKATGWSLIVPYDKVHVEPVRPASKFIAFDPGYRTFLTGVDSDGRIREYGVDWFKDLEKNRQKLQKYQSKYNKQIEMIRDKSFLSRNERQEIRMLSLRTRKIILKIHRKIRNRIDYMHKKTARQILNEYETILLPKLNSGGQLAQSDLCSGVKDMINLGAHCKFHKYISFQGKSSIVKVDERYTTKTCAKCMAQKEMKELEVYDCSKCGYSADRDVNSAINILVKNIGELACSRLQSNLPPVDNAGLNARASKEARSAWSNKPISLDLLD